MNHPFIQYTFYRHCLEIIDNKFLKLIVAGLARGIDKRSRKEVEDKTLRVSALKCESALITWALQHRKEKTGNVTSMILSIVRTASELDQWKTIHKEKQEELNEILTQLELPSVELDDSYSKNYFQIRDMILQYGSYRQP